MVNPGQAQRQICTALADAGVEAAQWESRLLLEHVLKLPHPTLLLPEEPLTDDQMQQLMALTARRCQHEPLQYLLGSWEFFGLEFAVGPGVLIPRQDTEVLVETAVSLRQNAPRTRLLDLCSGSGCIPAAIASQLPETEGDAVELSPDAMPYLRRNLQRHAPQVQLHEGDALCPPAALAGNQYDLITCNPPYLTEEDMTQLQPEVAFEPETALYGGADGLEFYRRLTPLWVPYLADGGWLLYEVGKGQGQAVKAILEEQGLQHCQVRNDLCGIDRVVIGAAGSPKGFTPDSSSNRNTLG